MIRRDAVREIDWLEVFPWLCLVSVLFVALDPRKIALALLGVLLTWFGWSAAEWVFPVYQPSQTAGEPGTPKTAPRRVALGIPPRPWQQPISAGLPTAPHDVARPAAGVVHWYSWPFWRLFARGNSWREVLLAAACAAWTLAVWAFCGGAITRLAAVRLTQDRRLGWRQAIRHAISHWTAYFCSPLFSLGGVLVIFLLPAMVAGLIARTDVGFAIVAFLWPLGMVLAAAAAFLLLMLLTGWPLMWCTISTERPDPFDSFGRSINYVSQRPFHYAFYIAVAAVLGMLGWFVVALLGEMTIYLTKWGAAWGTGAARAETLFPAAGTSSFAGALWVRRWENSVHLVVYCYGHSFFWCATSGVYLLLRRDTDATPLDDVHLDIADDPHGLPRIRRDAAGVAVLDEAEPVA